MKSKNPLKGKVCFTPDGMWMMKDIKFGGQLRPKVKPREWFYLIYDAAKNSMEESLDEITRDRIIKSWLGSSVTQWRTKKKLQEKGYL